MHRLDNVLVASAAAQVSLQPPADLFLARVRIALQNLGCGHDHGGRALAALQAVMLPERLLHRMQLAGLCQPFNSGDG